MDYMMQWVKNLTYFSIFSAVLVRLLPGIQYEKYAKFISGMILILLFLSPVIEFSNLEGLLNGIMNKENFQIEQKDLEFQDKLMDKSLQGELSSQYQDIWKDSIKEELSRMGYTLMECQVNIEGEEIFLNVSARPIDLQEPESEGQIKVENIVITTWQESVSQTEEAGNVKNFLSDFYNLNPDNINVSIRGGEGR